MNNKCQSRISQITGLTDPTTGTPILATLDSEGRIWIADVSDPSKPKWTKMPVPEPIEEHQAGGETKVRSACKGAGFIITRGYPWDEETCPECGGGGRVPTEKAGLRQELDSLLYHAAKDLDYLAADIDAHIQRLGGGAETARVAVAANLIRLAGKVIRQTRVDLVEGGNNG